MSRSASHSETETKVPRARIQIDRWNGNTMRRYHLPSRAKVVVLPDRTCRVIPSSCDMVSIDIPRHAAVELLATRFQKTEAA
jgi:hypothetical protein